MYVQLTNAGAALIDANEGPIELGSFVLGSDYGYTPSPTDTNIHGTAIYTGGASPFVAANANVVKYSAYLDYPLGPFSFGELGLFTTNGTLFALAASDVLISKIPLTSQGTGNSIRLDIYLSMVGTNYEMWLDLAESNNQFQMAILGSPDQLPQPQNATPNAYIISGVGAGQAAFLAYTDRSGLWNFDAYAYADQASATITGFDTHSVTIALSQYVTGMNPAYLGAVILEFSTGSLYGICRYVSSAVTSGSFVTLGFDNPLMLTPVVGDQVIVYGRQSLSTTIPNLPVATTSVLGGVIIGDTLTVTSEGLINVAAASYPVLSVNELTGNVVLTASNITGFAAVATSGNYSDLNGKPTPYSLPIASTTVLGGVMAPGDSNLTIAGNGVIDLGFAPVKTVNSVSPDGTGNVVITFPSAVGLVNPTAIAASTDFNTLQTCGLYFGLDANASTFLNAPSTAAGGTLDVEPFTTTASGGDVIQRYTMSNAMFFRRYTQSTNTWSTWVPVSTSSAIPPATTSTLGGVIVGAGLNVTGGGTISTVIQSVNGQSTSSITLTAANIGAVPTSSIATQGGVATLDITATTPVPATDPYTYGRLPFYQNTLGTWWNAGTWNANDNHLIQARSSITTEDANTSLIADGQQIIDISYGGNGVPSITNPDYQTVSGNGMVYEVTTAGTTSLDGNAVWNVGDLVVAINGKWTRIAGAGSNSLTSAASWYRSNPDGTLEIGGQYSMAAGTNSAVITLPTAIGTFLNGMVTDTGNNCYSGGVSPLSSTTITLYAPTYWVNTSGTVALRGVFAMQWRILATAP